MSAEAVDELAAGGHVLAAAAWLQHGSPDLAMAAALTALSCHPRTARGEDACLAYAQLATLAFQRQGYKCAMPTLSHEQSSNGEVDMFYMAR